MNSTGKNKLCIESLPGMGGGVFRELFDKAMSGPTKHMEKTRDLGLISSREAMRKASTPKWKNEFRVLTGFSNDAIVSTVESQSGFDTSVISRQIINLQEDGIRRALIELGWTPPEEEQ